MPANPRETYLENLAPLLARLVGTVHDEGPAAIHQALIACRALPAPHDIDPATAIPIVLAAMVDPTRRPSDLLAWTSGLLGHDHLPAPDTNELAIAMAIAGVLPAHQLERADIDAVVDELLRRGWTEGDIRDHLHADPRDADNWVRASRARTKRTAA